MFNFFKKQTTSLPKITLARVISIADDRLEFIVNDETREFHVTVIRYHGETTIYSDLPCASWDTEDDLTRVLTDVNKTEWTFDIIKSYIQ